MRYVVIMAGGSGTRLWPLSRRGTPKQLLKIVDGRSLLRLAFERALRLVPAENVLVVTGAPYQDAVRADLPELPEENLLGEPMGRDSLNACAWPAAVLLQRDPDAVIAQVTADHIIEPIEAFAASVDEAFSVAEARPESLVTLGVVPTSPHTGYGYLQRGPALPDFPSACRVLHFKEKPSHEVALQYLASGEYWWNSGMFVWRAATFLDLVGALLPETRATIDAIVRAPDRLPELFGTLHRTSVDYAIMEPAAAGQTTASVVAVALPIKWRDVGGFASLAEILSHDEAGNSVEGVVVSIDSSHNLIINTAGPDRLVATAGVHDLVIVNTPDATLVTNVDEAENVKSLVARIADTAPQFA